MKEEFAALCGEPTPAVSGTAQCSHKEHHMKDKSLGATCPLVPPTVDGRRAGVVGRGAAGQSECETRDSTCVCRSSQGALFRVACGPFLSPDTLSVLSVTCRARPEYSSPGPIWGGGGRVLKHTRTYISTNTQLQVHRHNTHRRRGERWISLDRSQRRLRDRKRGKERED